MSRTILAVVDDMFFVSKIRATAEALAVDIAFPRTNEALMAKVADKKPDMIVVDLHNQKFDPIELARQLKSREELSGVLLLGFFSHVNADLHRAALGAGYDQVIPRSVFSRDLAQTLGGQQQE